MNIIPIVIEVKYENLFHITNSNGKSLGMFSQNIDCKDECNDFHLHVELLDGSRIVLYYVCSLEEFHDIESNVDNLIQQLNIGK